MNVHDVHYLTSCRSDQTQHYRHLSDSRDSKRFLKNKRLQKMSEPDTKREKRSNRGKLPEVCVKSDLRLDV